MTARMTRAEDDPEALEALGLWDDVGTNFEVVSVQAWNNVIVQVSAHSQGLCLNVSASVI